MDMPNFPKVRAANQLYIHWTMDPPRELTATYLDEYEHKLNMTINYRSDADLPVPYGYFTEMSWRQYAQRVPFEQKNLSVAWMSSHCPTPGNRHLYIKELSKYIDVDMYGACGNLSCPRHRGFQHYLKLFERKYKFYLSF